MIAVDPSASRDICTACGLCCDGSLFSWTRFEPGDLPAKRAQFTVVQFPDGDGFNQPCPHFCVVSCAIYADRPAGCRSFQCRTLTELEGGEIEFAEALRRVAMTLEARARLLDDASGLSLHEVRALRIEPGPVPPEAGALLVRLFAIEILLDRWFRKVSQQAPQED